jgi:hypothetical protein
VQNIQKTSNVGVPGKWIFRVDEPIGIPLQPPLAPLPPVPTSPLPTTPSTTPPTTPPVSPRFSPIVPSSVPSSTLTSLSGTIANYSPSTNTLEKVSSSSNNLTVMKYRNLCLFDEL